MPDETNLLDNAPVPEVALAEGTEATPTTKKGRPSKSQEFAAYIKAMKELAALAKTVGGVDNLRDILDVMESTQAA